MSARPRLCSAGKSSAISRTITTQNAVHCSGVATFPAMSSRKSSGPAKPMGRQNALFAGAQGRGGQGAGGNGGNRRGNRTTRRGGRGGARGGKGIQGASALNRGQPFNGSNGFLSPARASDELASLQSARPPAQRVHCDDNVESDPQQQRYSWPGKHCHGRTATSTAEFCWPINLYVDHGADVLIFSFPVDSSTLGNLGHVLCRHGSMV